MIQPDPDSSARLCHVAEASRRGIPPACKQAVTEPSANSRGTLGEELPTLCFHRDTATVACADLDRGQWPQQRVFECIRCKHQASLTAGTLFDNTKLPLTTSFLAIYLLSRSNNGILAMDLKRQLGVSYNTAWPLKHRLMQAMCERDDNQPLRCLVEIDDTYLGSEASGCKRGRGAARRRPLWPRHK